ncbi:MAG: adenylate kinase [Candidatus Aenigmatarchaeota archaeon]|nr:MAG: adenylate kinase [Candidatus Aenigmarchaeota archaeon]
MRIVLLGPPGVGKGTHGDELAKKLGIPKISTGDIFREEVKKDSELGRQVKSYLDRGELVPDEIVIQVLKERISKPDCQKGFILDGFPRTLKQAEELEKITKIDKVINFVASEETIIDRISNRLTCKKCGAIYNLKFIPPKVPGKCDICGGELYQREDQKPEVVRERLRVYKEETQPLIDFYRKKGILLDLNAEGSKEEVSARLFKLVGL